MVGRPFHSFAHFYYYLCIILASLKVLFYFIFYDTRSNTISFSLSLSISSFLFSMSSFLLLFVFLRYVIGFGWLNYVWKGIEGWYWFKLVFFLFTICFQLKQQYAACGCVCVRRSVRGWFKDHLKSTLLIYRLIGNVFLKRILLWFYIIDQHFYGSN